MFHKCKCNRLTFNTGDCHSCWKEKHTFYYNQEVKIVDGFYKGQIGVVKGEKSDYTKNRELSCEEVYLVEGKDFKDDIWQGDLVGAYGK